jgi:hypothetical protein
VLVIVLVLDLSAFFHSSLKIENEYEHDFEETGRGKARSLILPVTPSGVSTRPLPNRPQDVES